MAFKAQPSSRSILRSQAKIEQPSYVTLPEPTSSTNQKNQSRKSVTSQNNVSESPRMSQISSNQRRRSSLHSRYNFYKDMKCDCAPDFYNRILGPTADESILRGVQTIITLGGRWSSCNGEVQNEGSSPLAKEIKFKSMSAAKMSSRHKSALSEYGNEGVEPVDAVDTVGTDKVDEESISSGPSTIDVISDILESALGIPPEVASKIIQTSLEVLEQDKASLRSGFMQTSTPQMISEILQTLGLSPEMASEIVQTSLISLKSENPSMYSKIMQTSASSLISQGIQTSEFILPTSEKKSIIEPSFRELSVEPTIEPTVEPSFAQRKSKDKSSDSLLPPQPEKEPSEMIVPSEKSMEKTPAPSASIAKSNQSFTKSKQSSRVSFSESATKIRKPCKCCKCSVQKIIHENPESVSLTYIGPKRRTKCKCQLKKKSSSLDMERGDNYPSRTSCTRCYDCKRIIR